MSRAARIEQQRRAARAARRRRWGWITTGVVVAALVATVTVVRSTNHQTNAATGSATSATAAVGQVAPDGQFTTQRGASATVASLRGRPTLLWFVVTSCPSVVASMPVMTERMARFRAAKVRMVVVKTYNNLGQAGPSLTEFGKTIAGANYTDPDWTFGTASKQLTDTYDPGGYPDIYYLLDSQGKVQMINGAPVSTMDYLLSHVAALA